jgi:hypothetical protein
MKDMRMRSAFHSPVNAFYSFLTSQLSMLGANMMSMSSTFESHFPPI